MFSYDFHIHSALSPCGSMDMTPGNIVNMAKLLEIDAIAVTDHNTIGNAEAVMKAGKSIGVSVVPGMEVETSEGVHVLTLYPNLERAREVSNFVYSRLPDIENKPEIFGIQAYMDENDNIIDYEKKLLISSASMSISELFYIVSEAGGLFSPAHVDRDSYSVLSNLGFIPEDIPVEWIEVSKNVEDLEAYLRMRPDLKKYKILRNSDAHYLESMPGQKNFLELNSVDELFNK